MQHIWAGKKRRFFSLLLAVVFLLTAVDFSPFASAAKEETDTLSANEAGDPADANFDMDQSSPNSFSFTSKKIRPVDVSMNDPAGGTVAVTAADGSDLMDDVILD